MDVAADVYGKHPFELTPEQARHCRTFIARRTIQLEDRNKMMEGMAGLLGVA